MRQHRRYPLLAPWQDAAVLKDVVRPEHLAFARLEPALRGVAGALMLDLVFMHGECVAVIPAIEVQSNLVARRESSPFIWPRSALCIGHAAASAIEETVLPWIEARSFERALNGELIRTFGDASSQHIFDKARHAGFPGAAPYERVLLAVAPYVYAQRFAGGASVGINDSRGAFGAVLLARSALRVRAGLGDEELNEFARRWFGCDLFGDPAGTYDVAVCEAASAPLDAPVRLNLDMTAEHQVQIATPVPLDVMVSFDVEDAPPARSFAVACEVERELRESRLTAAHAQGGSSGRILMMLRDGWDRAPDADTDEAQVLAALLRAEGFSVDVRAASQSDPQGYDLVHAVGLTFAAQFQGPLTRAHAQGVPAVVTAGVPDWLAEGAWGTAVVPQIFTLAKDETAFEDYLAMLAQRKLLAPGVELRGEPYQGYERAARDVLALAGAVIASGSREEEVLRALGFAGTVLHIPAILPPAAAADPETWRLGTTPFVLCHAPIEPRCNQALLVRAAAQSGLPLVVAGPIVDLAYYGSLREYAGTNVRFIDEPSPAEREALYRSARVYADVSWGGFGLHRTAHAAASGCALVVPRGAYAAALWREGVWQADPADEKSIALALGDAWMHTAQKGGRVESAARSISRACDARAGLVATAGAYASAQTTAIS